MANFDLGTIMDRLLEMEKEAVSSSDGVIYFPYQQEAFPYWCNRMTGSTRSDLGQDVVVYEFTVTARLVIAHLKEGYRGEVATLAYGYIEDVLDYFKDRGLMRSTANPTEVDDILADAGMGVEIVEVIGPAAFANAGIGPIQVGIDFEINIPVIDSNY